MKNYGSLIAPHTSSQELEKILSGFIAKENTSDAFLKYQLEQLKISIQRLLLLCKKYKCLVANPPYMGGGKMVQAPRPGKKVEVVPLTKMFGRKPFVGATRL